MRRVVVTGIGAVTPLGLDVTETWTRIKGGESGVGLITRFDASQAPVRIAAEVKNFDPTKKLTKPLRPNPKIQGDEGLVWEAVTAKDLRRVGAFTQLGVYAGLQAYVDSGIDDYRSEFSEDRFGVNIGVGLGGLPEIQSVHNDLLTKGFRRVTPFFITNVIPNMVAGQLSILLNLRGPNLCNVTACTSSAHSIGESLRIIQRGDADIMMAGGAESVICELGIAGFASMKALSSRNEEPHKASRPYDVARDGFVMGEGAAVLVLEDLDHAMRRGARIYGEIAGYGLSGDAHHITAPSPGGEGGERAMAAALKGSGVEASEIEYVNSHGTSTPLGDVEEVLAISRLLNPKKDREIFVSSTKSMTGHLLGAAGALEALFCILAIKDQVIPPTINLENLDPQCKDLGINFVPNNAIKKPIQVAMSNSFGFGGTNASLLLRKLK